MIDAVLEDHLLERRRRAQAAIVHALRSRFPIGSSVTVQTNGRRLVGTVAGYDERLGELILTTGGSGPRQILLEAAGNWSLTRQ